MIQRPSVFFSLIFLLHGLFVKALLCFISRAVFDSVDQRYLLLICWKCDAERLALPASAM